MRKLSILLFLFLNLNLVVSQQSWQKNPLHYFNKKGAFLSYHFDETSRSEHNLEKTTAIFLYFKFEPNSQYGIVFISDRINLNLEDSSVFEKKAYNCEGFYYIAKLTDSSRFNIYYDFKAGTHFISSFEDSVHFLQQKERIEKTVKQSHIEYKSYFLDVENGPSIHPVYEKLLFSNDKSFLNNAPYVFKTFHKFNAAYIALYKSYLRNSDPISDDGVVVKSNELDSVRLGNTSLPGDSSLIGPSRSIAGEYWVYGGKLSSNKKKIIETGFLLLNIQGEKSSLIDEKIRVIKKGDLIQATKDMYLRAYDGNNSIRLKPPIVYVLEKDRTTTFLDYTAIEDAEGEVQLWFHVK